MIPLPTGVRVWIAAGHTDMRRGMQSLALLVQEAFKRDPHLCVGRDYVAAHPRSPQLSGNAGLCRHILSWREAVLEASEGPSARPSDKMAALS